MRSEQEIRNEIERLKRVYSKAKCKYEEVINTLPPVDEDWKDLANIQQYSIAMKAIDHKIAGLYFALGEKYERKHIAWCCKYEKE